MLAVNHLRSLWGKWWFVPLLPILFVLAIAAVGDLRPEHVIVVAAMTIAAIATPGTKGLLVAGIPGIAIGFGYESMRYLRPLFVTPERVWGCNLREIELSLFPAGNGQTLADLFASTNTPFWDVFFAVPYTLFWGIAVIYGTALFFWKRERMKRFLWVLAISHAIAFVIWLAVPAAPPWYIRLHGCGIDIDALPNAAALLRLDELFGISYYESFYSRAPTVFGALPSLHCAFPMTGLVTAWRDANWTERSIHAGYTLWMLAASVYLDHHWLIDGLLGIAIVVFVHMLLTRFFFPRNSPAASPAAPPLQPL